MIYYLSEDKITVFKKTIAVKGEKIELISDHDNCIIAESKETGIRFSVRKNNLSTEFIPKDIIKPEIKKTKK